MRMRAVTKKLPFSNREVWMSVKHIFWQIIAVVFMTPVLAEDVKESPDEPKIYEFEEIVVTGSRIKSAESLSPAPVVVLSSDEIKDGASAIYGSDAIGGVVNIITRVEMDGVEIDYYEGISGAGDGEVRDLGITAGLQSEKGHILFSAGYHSRKPVWTGDRSFSVSDKNYDWGKNDGTYNKNGSSATPEGHIIDRLGTEGNEAWQAVVAIVATHPSTQPRHAHLLFASFKLTPFPLPAIFL